jgi:hypothetical protein
MFQTHRQARRENTGTMISTYAAQGGRRRATPLLSRHASPRQSFPNRCISGVSDETFSVPEETLIRLVIGHAPFPAMSAG